MAVALDRTGWLGRPGSERGPDGEPGRPEGEVPAAVRSRDGRWSPVSNEDSNRASLLAALEPLARPANADDARSGSQRRAAALTELARRALEAGHLPQTGGVRPQLTGTVDPGSLIGNCGPLDPQACRRLACDGAVSWVLVTRHPTDHHGPSGPGPPRPRPQRDLAARLQTAAALLPPVLGGAPTQPLEIGRSSRVVQAAQPAALAVREAAGSSRLPPPLA